jgi:hypothetical protein
MIRGEIIPAWRDFSAYFTQYVDAGSQSLQRFGCHRAQNESHTFLPLKKFILKVD